MEPDIKHEAGKPAHTEEVPTAAPDAMPATNRDAKTKTSNQLPETNVPRTEVEVVPPNKDHQPLEVGVVPPRDPAAAELLRQQQEGK